VKLNITIDVTPGTARRLIWITLTLLVAGIAGAAYAVPVTFVSQQRLTAQQLNQNFQDLDVRLNEVSAALAEKARQDEVPIITEWQAYTPAFTSKEGVEVSNQITKGYYRRVGDTLEVRAYTAFDGPPNSGSQWWAWGLPEDLTIDFDKAGPGGHTSLGHGGAYPSGALAIALDCYARTSRSISATGAGSESPYFNDTTPFVVGAGDQIAIVFTVPIQGWTVTE
jgi:hypothetical protein